MAIAHHLSNLPHQLLSHAIFKRVSFCLLYELFKCQSWFTVGIRFWCPRSGHINLADCGYLSDPDTEWGRAHNPDLISFAKISSLPCLVLLGEPGIGKTRTMETERVKISSVIIANGDDRTNFGSAFIWKRR